MELLLFLKVYVLLLAQLDELIHELVHVDFSFEVGSDLHVLFGELVFALVGEVEEVEGCFELRSELFYFGL